MTNEEKCKHYDKENGWCKKLSDWSDPMPHIVYCPKSPCEYAEPIDQPMNDNDIIKALGFCFAVGDCEHCAYADKPCQYLMADALDIINRQKAEIEKLTAKNRKLSDVNNDLNYQTDVWNPSQAIKEFAGRLKKELDDPKTFGGWSVDIIMDRIDNLVKEMTEGEDEN